MANFENRSLPRIFFSYFRPHLKLFVLDLVCALCITIIDLSFPLVSRWSLYRLIPQGQWKTFWVVMTLCFVFYGLRAVFEFLVTHLGHYFGVLVEADIRRDLFRHLQKMSYEYLDHHRTGQLMSSLTNDLNDITELAHHGPEDVILSLVTLVGALVMMFYIQWRLALVLSLIIPVFFVVVSLRKTALSRVADQVKEALSASNADFQTAISGMKTAKVFANEDQEYGKFHRVNQLYVQTRKEFFKQMGYFSASKEYFLCVMYVVVIAVGGALIIHHRLTVVDLVVFSLYVGTFVMPLRRLSNLAELLLSGVAGLKRFVSMMREQPDLIDREDAIEFQPQGGKVELRDVHFSYRTSKGVLNGVSLTIEPGTMVGIVGSSGGGKTTLCQLIPRLYDVTEGAVLIDGQDIRTVTQESLRRAIGIVQQDVFIFPGTVAENIRYGNPDADDQQVDQAAERAEIKDHILAMEKGYDTQVGERGVLLSGGQKQRISIARLFLRNPQILILDEATSALDSVTEAKIQETLEKLAKGRTTIVIAHRLSTVQKADQIVVMEKGKIVECGTHQQLMDLKGVYARLVQIQSLERDFDLALEKKDG